MYKQSVYPEQFLMQTLQQYLTFYISGRMIKKGRLLLFRKQHYYIQLSLVNEQNNRENFDIPIPFEVELYPDDNLAYFDYRVSSLKTENLPLMPKKITSSYFDKILEITIS